MIIGIDPGLKIIMYICINLTTKIMPISLICSYCGREYQRPPSRSKSKYCSQKCAGKMNYHNFNTTEEAKAAGYRKRRAYNGDKNPNWRGGGRSFTCRQCNKRFYLSREELLDRDGIYCSLACYFKYLNDHKVPKEQDRVHRNMRRSILRSLIEKNKARWEDVLGYTTQELMSHLEDGFKKGMAWDNYGVHGWHIDHIRPVSSFLFSSKFDDEFKKCWALSNLQPLWAKDNISKGAKWDKDSVNDNKTNV